MRLRIAAPTIALALSACGGQGDPQPSTTIKVDLPARPVAPVATSADDKVERMKAQLREEPKIRDLTYDAAAAVQWQIGVADDGSQRHGLAEYVCMELADAGLVDPTTNVRIVDIAKLAGSKGDFREASLGRVTCATGVRSDV
jgi:hypothetical protein